MAGYVVNGAVADQAAQIEQPQIPSVVEPTAIHEQGGVLSNGITHDAQQFIGCALDRAIL
jgi:hypothetical protein